MHLHLCLTATGLKDVFSAAKLPAWARPCRRVRVRNVFTLDFKVANRQFEKKLPVSTKGLDNLSKEWWVRFQDVLMLECLREGDGGGDGEVFGDAFWFSMFR